MPWEITIFNGTASDPQPLGSREDVITAFADSLPGVSLQRAPIPSAEWLEQMHAILREAVMQPKLKAYFEMDDLSIEFYAGDQPLLQEMGADVRGDGNPIPILAALCAGRGWSVRDDSDGSILELSTGSGTSGWEQFRTWRDHAIRGLMQAETPHEDVP